MTWEGLKEGKCPHCGKALIKIGGAFNCWIPEGGCGFKIWAERLKELIEEKEQHVE